ncbi:MAG: MucB/RseB C-terminal domain-containing protein [Halieaceae bacterium]|jgi:sigma-E factor negative regulatory protein RseB|nr:MucB/RseB C-terminal domain-containing protein [Halieaceae bacterium]
MDERISQAVARVPSAVRASAFALALCSGFSASFLALAPVATAQDRCPELDPEVNRLLRTMTDSTARGDYSGVLTLQRGNDMQVMQLSHRVVDGVATEVLSRLTGQDALVLRTEHPTDCTHPGHRLLKAASALENGVCGLAAGYRFHLDSGERIAGRDALRLRADPRDMYRFGYVFELDRETALMLKSTTYGADQRVLEQYQFASLSMDSVSTDGLPSMNDSLEDAGVAYRAGHPHPSEPQPQSTGPAWIVTWLPDGFMATDASPPGAPRKSFTDGLASFSVFLEPLKVAIKPGEGVERQGSTVAYTRGVALQQRPVLITVVGEIPTNTARMVADAVRLR